MLRLMGLPPAARYPRVAVVRDAETLTLRFAGDEGMRTVEVPLWTLGDEDAEAAQLRLLGRLRELGYAVAS